MWTAESRGFSHGFIIYCKLFWWMKSLVNGYGDDTMEDTDFYSSTIKQSTSLQEVGVVLQNRSKERIALINGITLKTKLPAGIIYHEHLIFFVEYIFVGLYRNRWTLSLLSGIINTKGGPSFSFHGEFGLKLHNFIQLRRVTNILNSRYGRRDDITS